jgi:PAS domain S-box-containing protein
MLDFSSFQQALDLLDVIREAVFVIFDEFIIYANIQAARLLGFDDSSEVRGRWSCEFISPENRQALYWPASKNSPFRYELKLRKKDGSTVDVETQISLIDYEGRPASLVFARDISKRKLFETKLDAIHRHAFELNSIETVEEVAKSTYKAMGDTLGFDDVGFGIVEGSNLCFTTGLGNEKDNILPMNGRGITVRAVNTGETQLISDVRKDPDYVPHLFDDDSENRSELCVTINIDDEVFGVLNIESERVNAFNDDDKKLLETLAEQVASAISIIRQKEALKESLQELERKNRELDEYNYAVSHDLKAPLRTIKAFVQFLLKDSEGLDEEKLDNIRRISAASDRMQRLVEGLLVLSRINRKFMDVEPIKLNELLTEVELDLDAQLKEKDAEIVSDDLPTIISQRIWIRQLFTNLISNGLKFNDSPEPKIWITHEDHYDHYVFSVKDNGIGIKEQDRERIFQLFQRLHTQEEYPGTGAGLTICKKIVESNGGRIWVESKVGVGSTFYFTIPKRELDEVTISSPDAAPEVEVVEGDVVS